MDKIINSQLFQSIKDKYLLMIAGGIFLLFFILIIIFNVFRSPTSQVNQPIPTPTEAINEADNPTSIPVDTGTTEDINQEQTAKDSGPIEFSEGQTDMESSAQEALADGSIKYTMDSLNPNRSDIVIIKNGSAIFTRHAVVGADTSAGYKNLLGKQSHTLAGPTFYGTNTLIYFYETGGTALIVDPKTETTYEEFTFQPPISLDEFNSTYKIYAQ